MFARLLILFLTFTGFTANSQKMKGFCFSSPKAEVQKSDIAAIANMNADWLAVVPYAYFEEGKIEYDFETQWKGERSKGIRKTIQYAHELGMKVMIKPDVWIRDGSYTGRFDPGSVDGWRKLESTYFSYISELILIAKEENVELFCIGSEWGKFIRLRTEFWKELISEIKKVYVGKLSYASNWDNYDSFPFWDQMDYIGVDAYWSLTKKKNPKPVQIVRGWKKVIKELAAYSKEQNKQIFFPEFGFRSIEKATVKPWDFGSEDVYSEVVQDEAFKAYFETLWKEDWFGGGFIWEWYPEGDEKLMDKNLDYTPQDKLAEETIREAYSN
jgi:hypothetical protein